MGVMRGSGAASRLAKHVAALHAPLVSDAGSPPWVHQFALYVLPPDVAIMPAVYTAVLSKALAPEQPPPLVPLPLVGGAEVAAGGVVSSGGHGSSVEVGGGGAAELVSGGHGSSVDVGGGGGASVEVGSSGGHGSSVLVEPLSPPPPGIAVGVVGGAGAELVGGGAGAELVGGGAGAELVGGGAGAEVGGGELGSEPFLIAALIATWKLLLFTAWEMSQYMTPPKCLLDERVVVAMLPSVAGST